MAIPDDPGVDDTGYPSSFTRQQLRSLREIWRILLGVMDGSYQRENPELRQKGSIEIDGDENADSGKGAFKGQPTNDNEKAKKRRELDRKMTEQMLSTLTPEELRDITWRTCMADSFDSLIARFGRARDWDVEATVAMLGASAAWRHKMKIPQLLEAGDIDQGGYKHGLGDKPADPKEAERLMKKYHDGYSYCCGTDRAGRPIVVVNILAVEMVRTALVPSAEEVLCILNAKGFGLRNWDFWAVKLVVDVFASWYPQSLRWIIFYQYNYAFYLRPAYAIIEPFLPAEIRDKVVFASNLEELLCYVDADHLPEDLGGNAVRKAPYVEPTQDDETRRPANDPERKKFFATLDKLNTAYEDATRKWIETMDDGGSSKDEDHMLDVREAIQAQRYVLCRNHDHLWRASTELGRNGVVREYGRTCHVYKQTNGKTFEEKWGTHSHKIVKGAPPLPKKLQRSLGLDDEVDHAQNGVDEEDRKERHRQRRGSKENGSARRGSKSKQREASEEEESD